MPFYDVKRSTTSNGSGGTETIHLWGTTVANQETVQIVGIYAAARFGTAGGCILRLKDNTGAVATGGTAQTPRGKNLRAAPAAQSVWKDDTTAITAGGTVLVRESVGFAATGGMGGYVPIVPGAAIQMMPNATNPVDIEFTSICSQASVNFDMTVDFAEGISA